MEKFGWTLRAAERTGTALRPKMPTSFTPCTTCFDVPCELSESGSQKGRNLEPVWVCMRIGTPGRRLWGTGQAPSTFLFGYFPLPSSSSLVQSNSSLVSSLRWYSCAPITYFYFSSSLPAITNLQGFPPIMTSDTSMDGLTLPSNSSQMQERSAECGVQSMFAQPFSFADMTSTGIPPSRLCHILLVINHVLAINAQQHHAPHQQTTKRNRCIHTTN